MSAPRAVARALAELPLASLRSTPLHVLAVGKAASAMAAAFAEQPALQIRSILAIGTHRVAAMPPGIEWHEAAHPVPDERSVAAARRALTMAAGVGPDECLVLLLSGGASALMAAPIEGLTLAEKQQTIRTMMLAGADIHALNTVRKHLSGIKGGKLAAACQGTTLTLAVSDVIGDDLSVIGSGPGVPDPTTWADAAGVLAEFGGATHCRAVSDLIDRGIRRQRPETPKPGDPALSRARGWVIASRRHALEAARRSAAALGYDVVLLGDEVHGEARETAPLWLDRATAALQRRDGPVCLLSAGETTVRVTGGGRGGRNQEFVLSLVERVASGPRDAVLASIGTDGIDGPTDAAGALIDQTSFARARALGLDPDAFLHDNNAYDFFAMLGDLIHIGRTDTNVGDLQILLTR